MLFEPSTAKNMGSEDGDGQSAAFRMELRDGGSLTGVRLGCVTNLVGRWGGYSTPRTYPQTIRIPLDAFQAVNPFLTSRPDAVVFELSSIVPDGAIAVSSLEFQRK